MPLEVLSISKIFFCFTSNSLGGFGQVSFLLLRSSFLIYKLEDLNCPHLLECCEAQMR